MDYFSSNKVFNNLEVNCLLDRLFHFVPDSAKLYLTGGVAKILLGEKLPYAVKDMDFVMEDDDIEDFLESNIIWILGIEERDMEVLTDRILARTPYIVFEFFKHQERSFTEARIISEKDKLKAI